MKNKDVEFKKYFECPECGEVMVWDGLVRTSIPPKYMHKCPKCGHIEYLMTYDPESAIPATPFDPAHHIFIGTTENTETASPDNNTITLQLHGGDADPCASCINNPKVNPYASGICNCTLPYNKKYGITC